MLRRPTKQQEGVVLLPAFYGDSFRDDNNGESGIHPSIEQAAEPIAKKIVKQDLLKKRSSAPPRVWHSRWVVLETNTLFYFDSRTSHEHHKRPRGAILLEGCKAYALTNPCDFKVSTPTRSYEMRASHPVEMREWIRLINRSCEGGKRSAAATFDEEPKMSSVVHEHLMSTQVYNGAL